MARKTRIEIKNGLYHIINRGNYRSNIFQADRTKAAFEKALFDVCVRSGWQLFAYVIMRNHFHLAIGTPQGNLVSGMQWLQATFANRFNRYRKESGHLFQGRYKSLIIEPGGHLCQVVNYIHLNPVRAGIVKVRNLERYEYSSFAKYQQRRRHEALECATWLWDLERLKDTPRGWRLYRALLAAEAKMDEVEIERIRKQITCGWCTGSKKYKEKIAKKNKWGSRQAGVKARDLKELNELRWELVLKRCLRCLKKGHKDIEKDLKSAEWKCAIASIVKGTTSATNEWIASQLKMGNPYAMSTNAGKFRREKRDSSQAFKQLRKILKYKT